MQIQGNINHLEFFVFRTKSQYLGSPDLDLCKFWIYGFS